MRRQAQKKHIKSHNEYEIQTSSAVEKKKDADRSRSTGEYSAAAEEGKFHVSVRVLQRA